MGEGPVGARPEPERRRPGIKAKKERMPERKETKEGEEKGTRQ